MAQELHLEAAVNTGPDYGQHDSARQWAEAVSLADGFGWTVKIDGHVLSTRFNRVYACMNGTLDVPVVAKQPGKVRHIYIKAGESFSIDMTRSED